MPPRAAGERPVSEAQAAQQERFRLAIQYSRGAKDRPEYAAVADSRKLSTFNVATADFLHPPEVRDIDLARYTGHEGDVIEVRAQDDVDVSTVGILVVGANDVVLEQGTMTRVANDRTLWRFVATRDAGTDHVRIIVDACDLASQVTRLEEAKTL